MGKKVNVNLIAFSSNKSVGTLIYTKRLFRQVYKINDKDVRFVFYAQKGFDFYGFDLPENTEIIRVPNIKSPLLRRIYEHTLFRFKLREADYIFTPYLTVPLLFSAAKQVVTIHDMVPYMVSSKYGMLKLLLLKLETKLSTRLSHKIITVSNNSKKDICQITGVDSSKVIVIYNFIAKDEPVVQKPKHEVDLSNFNLNSKYFINVSTLQPGKNVERMIRAFHKFNLKHKDYQLCIVGNKGWGFTDIYNQAEKLKMGDRVVFTGYLNDEDLSALYSQCYGVVYVSLYEGFGIPPLEGFYHGKAAVVSNNSSLPEVVGEAGVYVNPNDEDDIAEGLETFLSKKVDLEKIIEPQIMKFEPDVIVDSFVKLFS